jgi:ribosomal protein L11 methylase PrmA
VLPAFKTGDGVAWGDQANCLFCAVAQFFRPGYHNNLVSQWLPALDGVVEKLKRGARVADVGCGHGVSTVIMAAAFPNSQFIGYDFHPSSIEHAEAHAREHGVIANAGSRSERQKIILRRISISSPSSTACTTWATRQARRRMCGSP